ncbi:MAG: phosphatidic acid phosphatase, partial [Saprospiraceae bacterium]
MKLPKYLLPIFLCSLMACETTNSNYQAEAKNPDYIHRSVKQLTDVIVEDIFSPPVASRNYLYPCIAAYEVLVQDFPDYKSLQGQVSDLKNVPQAEEGQEYCFPLAATQAFIQTGKTLIFSEDLMEDFDAKIKAEFTALNMPKEVFDRSVAYGNQVSKHILDWSGKDLYKQTRTYPKYAIPEDLTKWTPTPPDYMDAIEPHWNKIRPMILDSAAQFTPPPPSPYNMDKDSPFYKELMEVYETVKNAGEEELAIASFWDCNPFVSHHTGHVMYATKKITPGGHWMNIASVAAKKSNADIMKAMHT